MQTVIRHSESVIKVVLARCLDLSAGRCVAHFSDVISCGKHYLHGSCIVGAAPWAGCSQEVQSSIIVAESQHAALLFWAPPLQTNADHGQD